MLRWGAENGFDRIAWTTGEQQAERYDLSKYVKNIGYQKRGDLVNITVWGNNDKPIWQSQSATMKEVEDYLGKEIVEKISKGEGRQEETGAGKKITYLEDLDLKVGGEGMKGFYDRIIPDFLNKYAKKWGTKVEETRIPTNKMVEGLAVEGQVVSSERGDLAQITFPESFADNQIYIGERGTTTTERNYARVFASYEDAQRAVEEFTKGNTVHSLPITESMKKAVLYTGQPRFKLPPEDGPSFTALQVEGEKKTIFDRARNSKIGMLVDWRRGKLPEGVELVPGVEKHGPQFGSWFRNMESILSQAPWSRKIYEATRDILKIETQKKANEWTGESKTLWEGLDLRQKLTLLTILDSTEEPKGPHPLEKKALQQRQILREVPEYFAAHKVPLAYRESYFPHMMFGRYWIKQEGEFARKVETLPEALQIAKEIAEKTKKKVTIMQDTFIPPDDATLLSKKGFGRLISVLQKELGNEYELAELSADDIAKFLVGNKIARPLPRKRFWGNQLPRLQNNPNFVKEIDKVLPLYFYMAARKVNQDRLMKIVQKEIEKAPPEDEKLKKFVQNTYLPLALSHPTNMEEGIAKSVQYLFPGASGQDVRRFFHKLNAAQIVMDMGLSFSTCVANGSQFWMNAYPIVGERIAGQSYYKGLRTFKAHELMAEVEEMGITTGVSTFTGEPLSENIWRDFKKNIMGKGGIRGLMDVTLAGFNGFEMLNRFSAYWAGKEFALNSLKKGKSAESIALKVAPITSSLIEMGRSLDERLSNAQTNALWLKKTGEMQDQFVKQVGFELNEKVNFRVGRENLPQALSEAPIRLFSPYKSFVLNQLKYTWDAIGPKGWKNDPMKGLRFVGMSFALGGVTGNVLSYGLTFYWINALLKSFGDWDLEKWAKRTGIWRGISGLIGLDISGSVALNMPKTPMELLGRFGTIGVDIANLFSEEKSKVLTKRKLWRDIEPAIVQRIVDIWPILSKGEYRPPISQTPIPVQNRYGAAVKRILGILPSEVKGQFELQEEEARIKAKFKAVSQDMHEKWAVAFRDGDQKALEGVIKEFVNQVSGPIKDLEKATKAKNEDRIFEALTELGFWKTWAESESGFESALKRKLLPRDYMKFMGLPKYMRPQAIKERERRGQPIPGARP